MPWAAEALQLSVTLDIAGGCFRFEWDGSASKEPVARGRLSAGGGFLFPLFALEWEVETEGRTERDRCGTHSPSARALLNRLSKRFPVADDRVQVRLLPDTDLGPAKAGTAHTIGLPPGEPPWKWLGREVQQFCRLLEIVTEVMGSESPERGRAAARSLARSWLGLPAEAAAGGTPSRFSQAAEPALQLHVTVETIQSFVQCDWKNPQRPRPVATGRVRCTGSDELTWDLWVDGQQETTISTHHLKSIRAQLDRWLHRFPSSRETVTAFRVEAQRHSPKPCYEIGRAHV